VHPARGGVSSGVFIAPANECGCIEAPTQWVLDETLNKPVVTEGIETCQQRDRLASSARPSARALAVTPARWAEGARVAA
jgi:EAL domain-containing protein (putative c-di-GMP-specific phosphodiesterase class I)